MGSKVDFVEALAALTAQMQDLKTSLETKLENNSSSITDLQISPEQRITVASFFMTGEALTCASGYLQPQVALFKLRQTSTVSRYQREFEILANRVVGLTQEHIMNLFVSGLKPEIQQEVIMFHPLTHYQAFELALMVEAKLPEGRGAYQHTIDNYLRHHSAHQSPDSATLQTTVLLSLAELPLPPSPLDESKFQVSFNALYGSSSPNTWKLFAEIHRERFTVLIDSRSTYNLIQPCVARFLSLAIEPAPSFAVMVGNGETLQCEGRVSDLSVTLQSHSFQLDLFLLDISGADLVLGIQWLAQLGPLLADFSIPSISFVHKGSLITLLGQHLQPPTQLSAAQLKKLAQNNSLLSAQLLTLIPNESCGSALSFASNPTAIHELLDQYKAVFDEPHGLPPSQVATLDPPALSKRVPIVPSWTKDFVMK
ncbi:Retrotransposon gag protein [Corchorus olitorius]|uniref:Retrotransposon gag protein n=1 Tax=Corchorus olitorius TaxID=93759 RepID=A0A1R3G876_9ROSI|nr:Retrotransposon gag protein [Corchorus olitorius]